MRTFVIAALAACVTVPAAAQSPPVAMFAAKPGESINLGANYWVSAANCQNLALAKPDFEVLSGPPGLKFEFREAMVIPQNVAGCHSEVKGGYVWVHIPDDIEGTSAHVVMRITQHDRNGPQAR